MNLTLCFTPTFGRSCPFRASIYIHKFYINPQKNCNGKNQCQAHRTLKRLTMCLVIHTPCSRVDFNWENTLQIILYCGLVESMQLDNTNTRIPAKIVHQGRLLGIISSKMLEVLDRVAARKVRCVYPFQRVNQVQSNKPGLCRQYQCLCVGPPKTACFKNLPQGKKHWR